MILLGDPALAGLLYRLKIGTYAITEDEKSGSGHP